MAIHPRGYEIQDALLERFRVIGWNLDPVVPVATRCYETVVGLKEATVWVQPEIWLEMAPGDRYPLCAMRPHYETEGRNILEPHGVSITSGMTEQDVCAVFDVFVEAIGSTISRHWTVRLL